MPKWLGSILKVVGGGTIAGTIGKVVAPYPPVAVGMVVATVIMLVLALCWVLADQSRTANLVRLVRAIRGG